MLQPAGLVTVYVFVYVLLGAFWVGAFWPLLLALRRTSHDQAVAVLTAFSRLALPAVGLLVIAGLILAWIQLQSVSDLVATDYGQRLALKLALVAGLLGLAAVNRWLLTPGLAADRARARPWLRRTLGVDLVLAALVVLVTASLGTVPPHAASRSRPHQSSRAYRSARLCGSRHGTRRAARARGNARAGGRQPFDLYLTDHAADPLDAIEAELCLSLPEQGIEALRVEADRVEHGRFAAAEVDLPVPGRWKVRADVLIDDFTKLIFRARIEVAR